MLVGQLTGDFVSINPAQLFLRNVSILTTKGVSRAQLADLARFDCAGAHQADGGGYLAGSTVAAEAHGLVEAGLFDRTAGC